ncbi:type II toxin-antitoxin system RelE/ParE family toxin [Rhodohalobacter sp.]|uniref:type II toxin-antitoxin system RelE/ParE family toxin n=1 Tax=Rhodohalobacter sp. TaxID=1974210 RepID=UPI002ACE2BB3|nr:type II toxin-antitoxin system RelE/ParE family toxin [Rhodohalobacter sp.]MDZ7758071.1 type II toxin-antitoxin system RelE/ParE family toxin [Rhodohalobacter sp.]
MAFTAVIDPRAMQDVQEAIEYYDEQQSGLGEEFEHHLNEHLLLLENNPFFQVRYDAIHCLPLKRFPFMIHYSIQEDQQIVTVLAVLNTFRSPRIWKSRK